MFLDLARDFAELDGLVAASVIFIALLVLIGSIKSRIASFWAALRVYFPGLKNTLALAFVL